MSRFIESIKVADGRFFRLPYHQARISAVFKQVFPGEKSFSLSEILQNTDYPHEGIFKCRIVFDKAIQTIEFAPYSRREIKSLKLVEAQIEPANYKAEERSKINDAFAQRGDCDDVIMLNNEFLSDTSYANIALWNGENWYTPTLPVIYGTQRAALLDAGELLEKQIHKKDLHHYKRIRIFNAMIEFGEIELDISSVKY